MPLKGSPLIYGHSLLTEAASPFKSRVTFSTTVSQGNIERINERLPFANQFQIYCLQVEEVVISFAN